MRSKSEVIGALLVIGQLCVGRNRAHATAIHHLRDRICGLPDCRIPRLRDLDSPVCRGTRWSDCRVRDTLAFRLRLVAGLPRSACYPSSDWAHALVPESVRDTGVLGGPVLHWRHWEHSMDTLRRANKPAAGNAGWTSQLAIERHRPGMPEPERWTI